MCGMYVYITGEPCIKLRYVQVSKETYYKAKETY